MNSRSRVSRLASSGRARGSQGPSRVSKARSGRPRTASASHHGEKEQHPDQRPPPYAERDLDSPPKSARRGRSCRAPDRSRGRQVRRRVGGGDGSGRAGEVVAHQFTKSPVRRRRARWRLVQQPNGRRGRQQPAARAAAAVGDRYAAGRWAAWPRPTAARPCPGIERFSRPKNPAEGEISSTLKPFQGIAVAEINAPVRQGQLCLAASRLIAPRRSSAGLRSAAAARFCLTRWGPVTASASPADARNRGPKHLPAPRTHSRHVPGAAFCLSQPLRNDGYRTGIYG